MFKKLDERLNMLGKYRGYRKKQIMFSVMKTVILI